MAQGRLKMDKLEKINKHIHKCTGSDRLTNVVIESLIKHAGLEDNLEELKDSCFKYDPHLYAYHERFRIHEKALSKAVAFYKKRFKLKKSKTEHYDFIVTYESFREIKHACGLISEDALFNFSNIDESNYFQSIDYIDQLHKEVNLHLQRTTDKKLVLTLHALKNFIVMGPTEGEFLKEAQEWEYKKKANRSDPTRIFDMLNEVLNVLNQYYLNTRADKRLKPSDHAKSVGLCQKTLVQFLSALEELTDDTKLFVLKTGFNTDSAIKYAELYQSDNPEYPAEIWGGPCKDEILFPFKQLDYQIQKYNRKLLQKLNKSLDYIKQNVDKNKSSNAARDRLIYDLCVVFVRYNNWETVGKEDEEYSVSKTENKQSLQGFIKTVLDSGSIKTPLKTLDRHISIKGIEVSDTYSEYSSMPYEIFKDVYDNIRDSIHAHFGYEKYECIEEIELPPFKWPSNDISQRDLQDAIYADESLKTNKTKS